MKNTARQAFTWVWTRSGTTDETAVEVTLNGILLPDGEWIEGQGGINWAHREGASFWALIDISGPDGNYPITATAKDAAGRITEAKVTFIKDTVEPRIAILSPRGEFVTNNPVSSLGTVDDSQTEFTRMVEPRYL
jgi:hypothetical protein